MSLDHAMSVPFKSSPVEFNQHLLFPTHIFDLLPKDHQCFLYAELFQHDTSSLESLYSVKGQNAYHPKLIVAILIYAYSQGVFSSRKIEKLP
jgi:transposase